MSDHVGLLQFFFRTFIQRTKLSELVIWMSSVSEYLVNGQTVRVYLVCSSTCTEKETLARHFLATQWPTPDLFQRLWIQFLRCHLEEICQLVTCSNFCRLSEAWIDGNVVVSFYEEDTGSRILLHIGDSDVSFEKHQTQPYSPCN